MKRNKNAGIHEFLSVCLAAEAGSRGENQAVEDQRVDLTPALPESLVYDFERFVLFDRENMLRSSDHTHAPTINDETSCSTTNRTL